MTSYRSFYARMHSVIVLLPCTCSIKRCENKNRSYTIPGAVYAPLADETRLCMYCSLAARALSRSYKILRSSSPNSTNSSFEFSLHAFLYQYLLYIYYLSGIYLSIYILHTCMRVPVKRYLTRSAIATMEEDEEQEEEEEEEEIFIDCKEFCIISCSVICCCSFVVLRRVNRSVSLEPSFCDCCFFLLLVDVTGCESVT